MVMPLSAWTSLMQGGSEYSDPTLVNETCWIYAGHDRAPITCRINELYNHWAWIECPPSTQVPDYFFISDRGWSSRPQMPYNFALKVKNSFEILGLSHHALNKNASAASLSVCRSAESSFFCFLVTPWR
jgi:hypothetical protein